MFSYFHISYCDPRIQGMPKNAKCIDFKRCSNSVFSKFQVSLLSSRSLSKIIYFWWNNRKKKYGICSLDRSPERSIFQEHDTDLLISIFKPTFLRTYRPQSFKILTESLLLVILLIDKIIDLVLCIRVLIVTKSKNLLQMMIRLNIWPRKGYWFWYNSSFELKCFKNSACFFFSAR